ncbi:DUF1501 domain-containing protein [Solitalea sp. MAHUQ-68]|uniref:DUF1501 domain-containing protein n=1 Tax=Solitalea agri TaxID=2953739 RepID=A0A9X2JFP9_9SPHI|nr:DUF1501 domain-containing protein [Solitalea agri]MCO4293666.1 DUF1501 domain-containing protein [Solitalea agri]
MRRRDFIRYTSAASIPVLAGGFQMKALASTPLLDLLSQTETDKVLVIIQLNGGNDGLNTVIPLDQYSNLAAARANILLPEPKILRLTNSTGLHPSMKALHSQYQDGKVRVIQNTGYYPANQSHFRSTDIWWTAPNNITKVIESGWIGRYLQGIYPGYPETKYDHPPALQIGAILSLGLMGELSTPMGISVSSPEVFDYLAQGAADASIPKTAAELELKYIRNMSVVSGDYSEVLRQAIQKGANLSTKYPASSVKNYLAAQLKVVARLLAGGLKTRIFIVNMGGFDTHADQTNKDSTGTLSGTHANLLKNLSDAIAAFQDDLQLLKLDHQVAGFTFSEFGRRIRSNASYGTDHGAAAPMFVFGSGVIPGILGANPQIPKNAGAGDCVEADEDHDFRNIYATILNQWFGVSQTELLRVMDNKPDLKADLNIFRTKDQIDNNSQGKLKLLVTFPNPFTDYTTIRFMSGNGPAKMNLIDTSGKIIREIINENLTEGQHEVTLHKNGLSDGIYYIHIYQGNEKDTILLRAV